MNIRKLEKGEETAFIEMALASWLDAYEDLFPEEVVAGARAMLEKAVEKRFDEFRVAARDACLLGYYSLGEDNYLWHLYVDPTCYRQGIGSGLLESAEQEIQQRGHKIVALDVLKGNERAIRFYQALGFHVTGEEKDEDGTQLLMEKEIAV